MKHQLLTEEETLETVDAFHPDTVAEVARTRALVAAAWTEMKENW